MQRKLWQLSPCDKDLAAQLSEDCGMDPILALLLASRGIQDEEQAALFLSDETELSDPFLLADMEKAVERVGQAIENFEKIAVFGDYDADGVTSTALLYLYLSKQGADVQCYIPDRITEGYGMSKAAIQKFKDDGVKLIVTVDTGVAAVEETEFAKSLGMDIVITDHHQPGETLPDAVAVVDPHRADCPSEFKEYAGVGVAFLLACALEGDFESVLDEFSDLVALGTLADVVSLTGENRTLVKAGVQRLNHNPRPGFAALKAASGTQNRALTASGVAFTLAPRINAAGRVGSAMTALKLLLCETEEEARPFAEEIEQENHRRQAIEAEISNAAIAQIEADPAIRYASVLVVSGEGWHPGVIGIVAARLVSRYGKPAVVITTDGDTGKGSCRSIDGFSIFDALCAVKEHLTHFGGHPGAAGLGVKTQNIGALREALDAYAAKVGMPFPTLTLDFKLNPSYINLALLDTLAVLEPCGCGNPVPTFGLYNMTLRAVKPVGEGKHLRLTLQKGITELTAMLFSVTLAQFPFKLGDAVDLAVQVDRNVFRGEVKPSVHIRAIRFSGLDEENFLKSVRLYEKYRHGDTLNEKEAAFLCPSRTFLLSVYKFIRANSPWHFDIDVFCKRSGCPAANAATVLVALDVLCELHLILKDGEGGYLFNEETVGQKADLADSEILKALQDRGGALS
ncbi:MAG TPA: single-stranded-DNA-specific exonuclease RecJ [Candidatus Fimenecus excrementavium]|nr:single-stranded-DNA-specific exonuclease RecJ [Candidatus Fimenecus excrementavium]